MGNYTGLCKARQVSDQMSCARCGYLWDVNDPEPPACKTDTGQCRDVHNKQLDLVGRRLQP